MATDGCVLLVSLEPLNVSDSAGVARLMDGEVPRYGCACNQSLHARAHSEGRQQNACSRRVAQSYIK